MTFANEFQRVYAPKSSLEIHSPATFEEFIPNLGNFLVSATALEDDVFRHMNVSDDQLLGKILVNRIYLSLLSEYYIRKYRIEIGYSTPAEQQFFRMMYRNINPRSLYFPVNIHKQLTDAIQCYSPNGLPKIRVPKYDPKIMCSDPIYHATEATTYNHVYIPFEHECLPATTILARLLYLIRHRATAFADCTDHIPILATEFLLYGNYTEREIRVTDPKGEATDVLKQLLHNIHLINLPECTPSQLAHSVDQLPPQAFPELELLNEFNFQSEDAYRPLSDMTPTKEWIEENSMFKTLAQNIVPSLSTVHYLPTSSMFGKLPLTSLDIGKLHPEPPSYSIHSSKPISFWIDVLSSPPR